MAAPQPAGGELERLIKESEESIKRLDELQKRTNAPAGQRAARHFRKHGGNLVSAALASCVFVVALGRLSQKYQFQAERDEWEVQRGKLLQEKLALEREVAAAGALRAELERAVEGGERRLLPKVAALLRAHREGQEEAPAAPGAADGGRRGAPPTLMI